MENQIRQYNNLKLYSIINLVLTLIPFIFMIFTTIYVILNRLPYKAVDTNFFDNQIGFKIFWITMNLFSIIFFITFVVFTILGIIKAYEISQFNTEFKIIFILWLVFIFFAIFNLIIFFIYYIIGIVFGILTYIYSIIIFSVTISKTKRIINKIQLKQKINIYT